MFRCGGGEWIGFANLMPREAGRYVLIFTVQADPRPG